MFLFQTQNVSSANLFDSEDILKISLKGPLTTLSLTKRKAKAFDFTLTTATEEHHIKVQARGNSRKRICHSPPLRINFSRSRVQNTLFEGLNKLKLVTQCEITDASTLNLLEEYAAYKIFNLISDISYKTRLLEITYVDTASAKTKNKKELDSRHTQYAFLIESESSLAQRLGGRPYKATGISLDSLDEGTFIEGGCF